MKKKPYIIFLVGAPLSGKSTWIKKNRKDEIIVSRDDIVMLLCDSDDYNYCFHSSDHKEIDSLLRYFQIRCNYYRENVIVDMTNMSIKSRRKRLLIYEDYYKIAVVFPFLTREEYIYRNHMRYILEYKNISMKTIDSMIDSYQEIDESEGFDLVIKL